MESAGKSGFLRATLDFLVLLVLGQTDLLATVAGAVFRAVFEAILLADFLVVFFF